MIKKGLGRGINALLSIYDEEDELENNQEEIKQTAIQNPTVK